MVLFAVTVLSVFQIVLTQKQERIIGKVADLSSDATSIPAVCLKYF